MRHQPYSAPTTPPDVNNSELYLRDNLTTPLRIHKMAEPQVGAAGWDAKSPPKPADESERPRKRLRPSNPDEARQQLLDEFLTPDPAFSTEWLNKLQQYAERVIGCRIGG